MPEFTVREGSTGGRSGQPVQVPTRPPYNVGYHCTGRRNRRALAFTIQAQTARCTTRHLFKLELAEDPGCSRAF